ncbi:hypothetical protein NUW54_g7403 [Trametes sanguinea]|uniref:Uncharacterized protein n=1 Tax=Trametes sanguinea TaxID=158606 RepID=A0ACC1PP64_9APHY|nr:hypothetical protein NUW54_g7403 [Trametes sanguinea]
MRPAETDGLRAWRKEARTFAIVEDGERTSVHGERDLSWNFGLRVQQPPKPNTYKPEVECKRPFSYSATHATASVLPSSSPSLLAVQCINLDK